MATRNIPLTSFDRLAASFFERSLPRLDRQIPVDAFQRDDRLVLLFDLPGVAEDEIELALERRTLTVRVTRPSALREGDMVFLAERPYGSMSRQIVLGETLDTDKVTAAFDRGVLTVSVPMAATAKSRRIEIGHAPVSTQSELSESADQES